MRGDDDAPVQRSASDPHEVAKGKRAEQDKDSRRRYLFHRLMTGQLSAQEGREFVNDVMFGDVGMYLPMELGDEPVGVHWARIARHNLGVQWLRQDVGPHRELYRQMLTEAHKRFEEITRERQAMAAAATTGDE